MTQVAFTTHKSGEKGGVGLEEAAALPVEDAATAAASSAPGVDNAAGLSAGSAAAPPFPLPLPPPSLATVAVVEVLPFS